MNRRISVRAIVLDEDRLLCVRQTPANNPNAENSYWNVPGGGLKEGESLTDCLRREIFEELGVKSEIGSLMYIQQFKYGDNEYLEFFYHVKNTSDFMNIDLTKTNHDGDVEIIEAGFTNPKDRTVLPYFLTEEPLQQQTGQQTKLFSYL